MCSCCLFHTAKQQWNGCCIKKAADATSMSWILNDILLTKENIKVKMDETKKKLYLIIYTEFNLKILKHDLFTKPFVNMFKGLL